MTHGRRYDFAAEISADNLMKDSRRMREQVIYVMDLLGNRHRSRSLGGDADCVHAPALFQWQRGPTGIKARCRWIE